MCLGRSSFIDQVIGYGAVLRWADGNVGMVINHISAAHVKVAGNVPQGNFRKADIIITHWRLVLDVRVAAQSESRLRVVVQPYFSHKIIVVAFAPDTRLYWQRDLFILCISEAAHKSRYIRLPRSAEGHIARYQHRQPRLQRIAKSRYYRCNRAQSYRVAPVAGPTGMKCGLNQIAQVSQLAGICVDLYGIRRTYKGDVLIVLAKSRE